MSIVDMSELLAGAAIDLAAAWHLVRGWKETSPARIRTLSHRARTLGALALFLGLVAAVADVALAFTAIESLPPEQRATALANRISRTMDGGPLALIFAAPPFIVALLLARRAIARSNG